VVVVAISSRIFNVSTFGAVSVISHGVIVVIDVAVAVGVNAVVVSVFKLV
jgi:hypothetical protein